VFPAGAKKRSNATDSSRAEKRLDRRREISGTLKQQHVKKKKTCVIGMPSYYSFLSTIGGGTHVYGMPRSSAGDLRSNKAYLVTSSKDERLRQV